MYEQIKKDLIEAMKSGDKFKLSAQERAEKNLKSEGYSR